MEKTSQYELTFILGEKASSQDATSKVSTLSTEIEKLNGKLTKQEIWGRRELAYEIKKNRSGIYTTLWLDLPNSAVKALEAVLRFDEEIIRSMVTKAYISAQPGSLYPIEEDKVEKGSGPLKDDNSSAEEMLRRHTTSKVSKKNEEVSEEEVSEEERIKKLDESLEVLLKDDKEEAEETPETTSEDEVEKDSK